MSKNIVAKAASSEAVSLTSEDAIWGRQIHRPTFEEARITALLSQSVPVPEMRGAGAWCNPPKASWKQAGIMRQRQSTHCRKCLQTQSAI